MDDRVKAGLRGPVSVCRTDVTMFLRACSAEACDTEPKEQTHWTMTRYHPNGRMVESQHHNPDGREWISSYTYDAAGLLREIETRDATGLASKAIYHYDQNGRLQRVVSRTADGREHTEQTFRYDGERKTKTLSFHSTPERPDSVVAYTVEGSEAAFSAPGATSMTTVYDDQDRPVETLFHDSQQRVLGRVNLRYDEAGRMVEESQTTEKEEALPAGMLTVLNAAQLQTVKTIFGGGNQGWKHVHRYAAQGHRVETVTSMGARGFERRTMAYNDYGDLSEQISVRTCTELSIDDKGRIVERNEPANSEAPTSEARFSYQYDERGNWTERIVSTRSQPDQPFAVCSVERRSLTYQPA